MHPLHLLQFDRVLRARDLPRPRLPGRAPDRPTGPLLPPVSRGRGGSTVLHLRRQNLRGEYPACTLSPLNPPPRSNVPTFKDSLFVLGRMAKVGSLTRARHALACKVKYDARCPCARRWIYLALRIRGWNIRRVSAAPVAWKVSTRSWGKNVLYILQLLSQVTVCAPFSAIPTTARSMGNFTASRELASINWQAIA